MSEACIYDKIIDSKSGVKIPVFTSGRTVDSRYDPVRESLRILQQIKPSTRFVIVLGIASGTLINTIKQRNLLKLSSDGIKLAKLAAEAIL